MNVYSSKSSIELTTLYYYLVPFLALSAWLTNQSTTTYTYNTDMCAPATQRQKLCAKLRNAQNLKVTPGLNI